jgi:L-ascorbate metabolism protein UlaG (beta-lactamase superfamily)
MHITWLGTTAIKIQTKHEGNDIVSIIDPYRPKQGDFPRSLAPDVALLTRGEEGSITLSGSPFILAMPGECETKGVLITAVAGPGPNTLMLRLDAEGISFGHLGLINKNLSNKQFDALSGVDVLCLPVGSSQALSPEIASKIISIIEPRIVIPIAFKCDNDPQAGGVESFLKEMGATNTKPENKIIIKKKDLPQEETQIVVLTKE